MKRWLSFFPLFLFILNFFLQFLCLTEQEIAHDEPFSIYHAQFGVATIIEQLKAYNNPPLFEIILHYWIKLFGISPLAIRMLPLLFGTLCPVALYYLVKKSFSVNSAIASSLLLSFSTLLIYYSHDCRVYTLFMLLSILSMYYYMELISDTKGKIPRVFYILVSALLIYAHYFGIIVLLIQFLHLVFCSRKMFFRFLLYWSCILIAYIPHLIVLIERFGYSAKHGTWLEAPVGVESLYNMIWSFSNEPMVAVTCIGILVLALVFGIFNHPALSSKKALIVFWFVVPFFGMFAVSYWLPMYISRYLIFALPGYYVLLTLCVDSLIKSERYRNIVFVALVTAFAFTVKLNPDKKQYIGEAIEQLNKLKTDSTIVLVTPYDLLPSFAYNYNRDYFSAVSDNNEYDLIENLLERDGIHLVNNADDLNRVDIRNYKHVIYLRGESETSTTIALKEVLDSQFESRNGKIIGEYYCLYDYKRRN
jgi:uncharacterized membrane protein